MSIDIRRFAADPVAFFESLVIPAARGTARFGDVMGQFQRDWFKAIAPALLAVASGKPPPVGRYWTERTKGGSKDTDAACALLWLMAFSRRKLDMQVGASDKDQALELKKAACDILRLNGWLGERIEAQSWTLLCRATGSELTIISSDVASSHGARPDVVCLNELSHITKEEFAQNLLDNASKKPQGLVIVASNAGFVDTWQHRWRETFRHSDRWNFHAFSQPAPWLSEAELAEAERRNSRARFQRLFWGIWISAAGDALDESVIAAAIKPDLKPITGPLSDWQFVCGVDVGLIRNHTGLCVLGVKRSHEGHGLLRLAHARTWRPLPGRRVDLAEVEAAILDLDAKLDLKQINVDPYEARYLISRLQASGAGKMAGEARFGQRRKEGLPLVETPPTSKNLVAMASSVIEAFNDGRVQLFPCPELVRDIRAFKLEEKSYGFRLVSPVLNDGSHGDLGYAFALAVMGATELLSRRISKAGIFNKNQPSNRAERIIEQDWLELKRGEENPHSLQAALRDGVPITFSRG